MSTKPGQLQVQSDLKAQYIIAPQKDVVRLFDRLSRTLFGKVEANEHESQTLAALRDSLLPKLISGQVLIKDSEKLIEEVLYE